MEKLIRFKQGIDSLDDVEYKQFLDSCGRKKVITLMFNGFLSEINQYATESIDNTNKIISEIIASRKNQQDENGDANMTEIDTNCSYVIYIYWS